MRDKIIELRKSGFSYNEISKELGCAKSTISYHCSKLEDNNMKIKNNLKIKNKKQKKEKSFLLKTTKINEVINLRKKKKTYNEIREITGLSLHIISKICREFDLVKTRKHGEITQEEIDKIILLYEELKSTRKVSNILNISRSTIIKYVNIIKYDKILPDELKRRKIINVINWRKRVKIKLVEYKGGKCEKCGYDKYVEVLEFHHKDEKEKDFTISGKSWSYERLKKEVDKCLMLCSNCHKEIHINNKNNMPQ